MNFDVLPEGWKVEPVSALADPEKYSCVGGPFGSSLTRKDYVEYEGVPISRGNNLKIGSRVFLDEDFVYVSEEKAKKLEKNSAGRGDIILTQRGTIGQVAIIPDSSRYERYILSQNQMKITLDHSKVNPKYFLYYFLSKEVQDQIQRIAIGGVIPGFNLTQFREFEVVVPPLNDQDEIVAVLDSLDSKIELNRQTNQTLEQIAQAIFKSWFVDFEPTRAKIAAKQSGHDPERAAMAAISGKSLEELDQLSPEQLQQLKTTAALFPDVLADYELGEIPEGWSWSYIGDEVTVVGGGTPSTKSEEFWENGHINWTSPKDLSKLCDKILLETDRKVTEAGLAKISSGLLPIDTVLMSSRAPVGYLAISKIPVAVNQGYIAMKCNGDLMPEYIVQWAESVMDDIKQRASGTTFAEISKKDFKIIPVVVPEKEVVFEYSAIVSKLYDKITKTLIETKSLEETRDYLLPKLLSGELELAG